MLDPALATIIVAVVGVFGTILATRASKAGKARELALDEAAARRADLDVSFTHLERSRDAAIADAARWRAERDRADAHNALLVHALVAADLPVPPPPRGGAP